MPQTSAERLQTTPLTTPPVCWFWSQAPISALAVPVSDEIAVTRVWRIEGARCELVADERPGRVVVEGEARVPGGRVGRVVGVGEPDSGRADDVDLERSGDRGAAAAGGGGVDAVERAGAACVPGRVDAAGVRCPGRGDEDVGRAA